MIAKISVFVTGVEAIIYYIICMTVPLNACYGKISVKIGTICREEQLAKVQLV